MKSKIRFEPRWKEELVCTMDGHEFILEFTMGISTAYLPTESKWESEAPVWAKGTWVSVSEQLAAWCRMQKIPLEITENAWVNFSA